MLSYGIIGTEDYEQLSNAVARLNSLVHGFKTTITTVEDVTSLVTFVRELVKATPTLG